MYAQTVKDGEIRHKYMMAGNEFYVQTLNLNQDFARIKAQLDDIVNLIKDKKLYRIKIYRAFYNIIFLCVYFFRLNQLHIFQEL